MAEMFGVDLDWMNKDIVKKYNSKYGTNYSDTNDLLFNNNSSNSTTGNLFTGIDNLLTGNLDWQRQLALQDYVNSFNADEAGKTRLFNSLENQKQRDWYTQMSNTAYQRQVKDMQNAGINPYAALSTGAQVAYGSAAYSHSANSGFASTNKSGTGVLQAVLSTVNTAMKNANNTNNALVYAFSKMLAK